MEGPQQEQASPDPSAEAIAPPEARAVTRPRDEAIVRRVIPCDVLESDEAFLVIGELPGVARDDLSLDVQANTLTLRGERRAGGEVTRFERSFVLPNAADVEQIQATLSHGIVRVEIGKTQRSRPRKIQIA